MPIITVSRVELLHQKKLLEQAQLGKELLEERLVALLTELKEMARDLSGTWNELVEQDLRTMTAYNHALSQEGGVIESLAGFQSSELGGKIEKAIAFGTVIPKIVTTEIITKEGDRYIPVTVSSSVDVAARKFETLYSQMLTYAEKITVLQRLATEIRKTRRRMMVLEEIIIPETKVNLATIEFGLNEREREEQVRIRKFKAMRQ